MAQRLGHRESWPGTELDARFGARQRLRVVLTACLFLVAPAGCAGITAHEPQLRNSIDDWWERAGANRNLSDATSAVLFRQGLLDAAANDPAGAARALEARLFAAPEPDGALALAELSYNVGLMQQASSPSIAIAWYRDAGALAVLSLTETAGAKPELAQEIHNKAVARMIRLAGEEANRSQRNWREILGRDGISVGSTSEYLDSQRIAELRVARDLRVTGMDHVYSRRGLGVPLVARRLARPSDSPDYRDRYLPKELETGATAVLVGGGGTQGGTWRRNPPSLILFDPFEEQSIGCGPRVLDLAADLTTPLAAQLGRKSFATLEWMGLLEPSFKRAETLSGLYMLRPYEPGKIPVVFVHGLVSSPRAWIQTINELRNTPELSARYQFWVFLYPTGMPIPTSAARLRKSLVEARGTLDPAQRDPALDRLVLVGHSMGGILSKMMTQDSRLVLWDSAINVAHDRFKSPPELATALDDALIFRPLPFVRRVVFIASPHRGSPLANDLLGRVVSGLVQSPDTLNQGIAEIEELNGPHVISRELKGRRLNAIGNLRTDSPILAALDRIPIDPAVPYHSIIPLIGGYTKSDGVVQYRSSHLEGALSERIVSGTHFSQSKPDVTGELRRILREHLDSNNVAVATSGSQTAPPARPAPREEPQQAAAVRRASVE